MLKRFGMSLSMSGLLSIRRGRSFKPSNRPIRLIPAVLGGFVLVGIWQFVMIREQSTVQAARVFRPYNTGLAIITRPHVSTGTTDRNGIVIDAYGPLCDYADLKVGKTDNNPTPEVAKAITYTVTVTNGGPDDATGVQLTDMLPESVIFGSATSQNVCTEQDNTITCDLGPIPNDATAIVTIVVTPTKAGTITNMASVTGNESDPDRSNNTAEKSVRVVGADLVVTKTVNITAPNAGDIITYTITVANNGPDEATGVQVIDVLPKEVAFDGYTATQGTYITATGLWSVDNLVNAASATMTIAATVISCTGHPTIPNTASISAAWPNDPDMENNASRAVITPTSGVYCLYLPSIFKNYEPLICTPYFDDFSDPYSGWEIDNSGDLRSGYTAGEYFLYNKVSRLHIVTAPTRSANRYVVEVDVHWDNANIGYEYGMIFGQTGSPYPAYFFGVDPVKRMYRLSYNSGSGWQCINQSDPCWVYTSTILAGANSNHLKASCNGDTISLYVNNDLLWHGRSYSCRGQVGLFIQSSPTNPKAYAYFDNFQINCPFE